MTRLLVTDLDGTLLDPDGLVHDRDREAIVALRRAGVHVALCTGRLYSGTRHVAEELELTGPVACVDGSHIVDAHSGRALHLATLDAVQLGTALRCVEQAGLTCFVFAGDAVYYDAPGAELLSYVSLWSRECLEVDRVTAPHRWGVHQQVMALVALGAPEHVHEVGTRLNQQMGLYCAWFDVRRPGFEGQWGLIVRSSAASKGTAVRWLAQHHGVARQDVIVVGDWLNDVPMFEWAGQAFAMAQAPDEVKRVATCVLDAHTTEGGGILEAARRAGWLPHAG
ncbi:MAG: HAD hydrolase family protein [Myxococcales bacterium]|nr:HAD hydrolase family protein [Myxococcales bacterium]